MELKNFMEDVVINKLDSVLAQYPECCHCDKCRQDIVVLALNHLPTKYVSSEKGEIITRVQAMSIEYEVDVIQQLINAIQIVSQKPRHEVIPASDSAAAE